MALKFNFKDFDAKQFLLLHVEKIAFGALALLGLYLAYESLNVEIYPKKSEDLVRDADGLRAAVQQAKWEPWIEQREKKEEEMKAAALPPPPDPNNPSGGYLSFAVKPYFAKVDQPFALDPSVLATTPWNPSIDEPILRRSRPAVYDLEALEVSYGHGAFAIRDANAEQVAANGEVPAQPGTERQPMGTTRTPNPRPQPKQPSDGPTIPAGYPGPSNVRGVGQARYLSQRNLQQKKVREGNGERVVLEQVAPAEGMGGGAILYAGQKAEGFRWIAITGRVPFSKQQREFFEKLQVTTRNVTEKDYVNYLGFKVQRAEVASETADLSNAKWTDLQLNIKDTLERWAEIQPEPVDQAVLARNLCSPLPPLIDRLWEAREVVHSDFHNHLLKDEQVLKQAEEAEKAAAEKKSDEAKKANQLMTFDVGNPALANPYGDSLDRAYAQAELKVFEAGGPGGANPQVIDSRMFRFFDFAVEPGKFYAYRVQLVLSNPNFGVSSNVLMSDDLAKDETLTTGWSAPSKVLEVPKTTRFLAGGIKGGSIAKESLVTLMISQWNQRKGVNASKSFEMTRGQFAYFLDQVITVVVPGQQAPQKEKLDFKTNFQLVDFFGGFRLRTRSRVVEPAELLLMDDSGNLRVHRELADKVAFDAARAQNQERQQAIEEEPAMDPFGGFDPFGAPPPMPGGRGR